MFSEIFPSRLKKIREKVGLSQTEVAKELKIDQSTLAKYETGARMPDLEKLGEIATFFEVSADWLIGLGRPKTEEQTKKERQEEKNRQEILKHLG